MSNPAVKLVQAFYTDIWNRHDHTCIPLLLHEAVRFRGSLGFEAHGHAGFAQYLDRVHAALAEYECRIEDLVCEPPRVFARMLFSGQHRGELLGFAPTGRRVSWQGAALFTIAGNKIADIWVLGDIKSLEAQLAQH